MAEHSGMAERTRLAEAAAGTTDWKRWGPYLAERQWGTVREDYSPNGDAWDYFPHDHARSRAYRWGEDGLLGICDDQASAVLRARAVERPRSDPQGAAVRPDRAEGNHGEDVKECYFYLDATPTHSLHAMRSTSTRRRRFPTRSWWPRTPGGPKDEPEFELVDTGVFDEDRYFDVDVEYAKAVPDDILIRITVTNRGPEPAATPTCCRRSGSATPGRGAPMTGGRRSRRSTTARRRGVARRARRSSGDDLADDRAGDRPLLFTENETNAERLFGAPTARSRSRTPSTTALVDGDRRRLAIPQRRHQGRGRIITGRSGRARRGRSTCA